VPSILDRKLPHRHLLHGISFDCKLTLMAIIELDSYLAAAITEQIGFDFHSFLLRALFA
jgi:hypothetical protein